MMRKKRNLLTFGKSILVPSDEDSWEEFKEVVPFFLLVTLALGWMYVVFVPYIKSPLWVGIFTLLMVIHLVIYWLGFHFIASENKLWWYFILQGTLATSMVMIVGDEGLVMGLFGPLIGITVGMMRKTRSTILIISLYLVVAAFSILVLTNSEVLYSWAVIALPLLVFTSVLAFLFRKQAESKTHTQNLLEELQVAHQQLEAYTNQVEDLTLSNERQRMARELHDTLAQGLAGLILKLEAVSTHIEGGNNDRAQEILHDAMTQSRTTLAEARMVIDDLRSEAKTQSMEEAVRSEVRRFEALSEIPCEVIFQHASGFLPETREHILKIISEGLNNTAKHAGATQAWLRLIEINDGTKVEIEDDGRGFVVTDALKKEGSYGLLGIRERAELLHGTLEIDSAPGDGVCLTVLIPRDAEEGQHD